MLSTTATPLPPFGRATLPVGSTPMVLPSTALPSARVIFTPFRPLPATTLPSVAALPPIMLPSD